MRKMPQAPQRDPQANRARVALICGLLSGLALLAAQAGPSWAQPHQNALRDTINTPIPTATDGPTSTPSPTTPPGVQRVLLREGEGYDGTSDTSMYAYTASVPQPLDGGLKIKGGGIRSVLIRFDLTGALLASALPAGANIVEAELVVYVDIPQFAMPRSLDVAAYRVLRDWDEAQASWDYAHTADAVRWQRSGCDGVDVDRLGIPDDTITLSHRAVYRGWNVTDSVTYWLEHPGENYGWLMKGVSPSTAAFFFCSSRHSIFGRRPVLRIDYTLPETTVTPTPTGTTPTPTPTIEGNSILVTVYDDADRNGWLDPGEQGIAGVTVELLDDATGQVLEQRVTYSDGTCAFGGLAGGWYRLRERNPWGYVSTTADEVRTYLSSGQGLARFGDYRGGAVALPLILKQTRGSGPVSHRK